mgnify:CR=1 FL=1
MQSITYSMANGKTTVAAFSDLPRAFETKPHISVFNYVVRKLFKYLLITSK